MRHPDFEYIFGEFKRYYKDEGKANSEYQAWLKALKLNDSKSYGQARESFQWAKDMISRFREDIENVYYKVLVGFPTRSMNRNTYKERDLVAAAHTLVGKHPSINHKDDFWLSPDNPHNHWGIVTVVAAAPEDGAVEAILQVPKTAICPVCNGAKLTELIDNKRIYNVSLEGECMDGSNGVCDGFEFTDHGFSLLTSDVLPGIPMTKIFPMESYMYFMQTPEQRGAKKRAINIVGLKTTEGELSGMANVDEKPKTVPADSKGQCPEGYMYSAQFGECLEMKDNAISPSGYDMAKGANKANSNLRRPRAETPSRPQFKPEGETVELDKSNFDKYHPSNADVANQAMGNPTGCRQSDIGIQTAEMPGGNTLASRSSPDQPAYGRETTKPRKECTLPGDMKGLAGQTHTIIDAGDSDKHHPDKDGQWLIEKGRRELGTPAGAVGTHDVGPAMKRLGKDGGLNTDSIPKSGDEQPANNGDGCPEGMKWSVPDGMCVSIDSGNETTKQAPLRENPTPRTREGPNIYAEPSTADDTGHPPIPPIDQPTSNGIVFKQCPDGYVFDPDTGMCQHDAAQTEMGTPDARTLSNMDKARTIYNPSTPLGKTDAKDGNPTDSRQNCRDGLVWNSALGMCAPAEANMRTDMPTDTSKKLLNITNDPMHECPDGYVWSDSRGMCRPTDDAPPTGDKSDKPNSLECTMPGSMKDLAGQTHMIIDPGGSDKHHPDNDSKWLIERIREAQMLANTRKEYEWDDCIADQMKQYGDMDTAKRVCGTIKFQNQSVQPRNHELELSAALSSTTHLEAKLAEERVKNDATVKGLKALVAQHWEAYQTEKDKRLQLDGRLKEISRTIDAHEEKVRANNNERLELEGRLSRRERDLTEALENASKFKKLYEDLQLNNEQTEIKYREALKTNLALNKQITKSNEDYLGLAREKEQIEEQLKHAQRLAKHIIVKTRM